MSDYINGLLGKNEKIMVATRRHLIALLIPFVGNFSFFFLLIFLVYRLNQAGFEYSLLLLPLTLYPIGVFIRDYLRWLNERYYVTNRRVVQSEGIINKRVIDSSLEKVNDVILVQTLLGRCLDYGNIEILTASEIGVNDLLTICQPVKFKTEMINQKESLGDLEDISISVIQNSVKQEKVPSILNMLEKMKKQNLLTEEEFLQKKSQLLKIV